VLPAVLGFVLVTTAFFNFPAAVFFAFPAAVFFVPAAAPFFVPARAVFVVFMACPLVRDAAHQPNRQSELT
jgi:hypothetical protein